MLPAFGMGLLMIIPALMRLARSGSSDRRKLSYGADCPPRIRQEHQVAHI